jgi:hypothetical protein
MSISVGSMKCLMSNRRRKKRLIGATDSIVSRGNHNPRYYIINALLQFVGKGILDFVSIVDSVLFPILLEDHVERSAYEI